MHLMFLPSQQPGRAGQSCQRLFTAEDPWPGEKKGLIPSNRQRRTGSQARFYNEAQFKGSLSFFFSLSLRACPALLRQTLSAGGGSALHHTPKDTQIFLSHLFRVTLRARRTRPKIMATKESARTE